MKYYKISEEDLIELLAKNIQLDTLFADGVDNWSWYGEGFERAYKEHGDWCESFEDCAATLLDKYEEVE